MLKLALLYENGGILVAPNHIFVSESFKFIEGMFDNGDDGAPFKYNCQQNESFLYIPFKNNDKYGRYFTTSLIAAVPKSTILKQAFDILSQVLTTGKVPYNDELKLLLWDGDISANYLKNSLEQIINLIFYQKKVGKERNSGNLCKIGMQTTQG